MGSIINVADRILTPASDRQAEGPDLLSLDGAFPRSWWFGRFRMDKVGRDQFYFRDMLFPAGKVLNGDVFEGRRNRDLLVSFFRYGFVQCTGSAARGPVRLLPMNESDCLFWQYPCQTEAAAWNIHAQYCGDNFHENCLHIYLGLPWATWIDKQRKLDLPLEEVPATTQEIFMWSVRLGGLGRMLATMGVELRVHTVCQHIYWADLISVWRRIGITDLWLSHCPNDAPPSSGFSIHPWSLYAVNVEDACRRAKLTVGKDIGEKSILASFVGAHMPHYLSDIRLRLKSLANEPGFIIRVSDRWHFENIVYEKQIYGDVQLDNSLKGDVETYNEILSDSVFALCPSGAGSNTLRLWEALAVGAIPVLLGELPRMPQGGSMPYIEWNRIVLTVLERDLGSLPQRLKSIPAVEVRERQRLGMEAYELVRSQRCF